MRMGSKAIRQVLGFSASVSTTLTFLLTVYAAFFNSQLGATASRVTGPIPEVIRAEYVASQVHVFYVTAAIIVFLISLGVAGIYFKTSAISARSIAVGHGDRGTLKFLSVCPALFCILLGIYLPRAIFQVTNPDELSRQMALLGWATRSPVGGTVLGLIMAAAAMILAWGVFAVAVLWPRHQIAKKYERLLETA